MALHVTRVLPWYRKLMREGAQCEAIILDAQRSDVGYRKMTLEVRYPDGSKTQIVRDEVAATWAGVGVSVPMRYDPDNRERIEVDVKAMEARFKAEQDARDTHAVTRARDGLSAARAPATPAQDVAARLEQAKALHAQGVLTDAEYEQTRQRLVAEL